MGREAAPGVAVLQKEESSKAEWWKWAVVSVTEINQNVAILTF